ncbi:hypothetical protein GSI_09014 [Ganoderma sinense ZZ0214-1]|uniref:Uncharacterized protein n=1 Tax=Ganoderma sinense ZZ0214-1 TaxID=1077348 RepID=A0A2G8S5F3_9APHY|nr:hypothetical protein GSI_09014 [Ganoderma sinense ZZ0214-1]
MSSQVLALRGSEEGAEIPNQRTPSTCNIPRAKAKSDDRGARGRRNVRAKNGKKDTQSRRKNRREEGKGWWGPESEEEDEAGKNGRTVWSRGWGSALALTRTRSREPEPGRTGPASAHPAHVKWFAISLRWGESTHRVMNVPRKKPVSSADAVRA